MKLKTVFFVFLGAILCANCVAEEILEVRLSSIAVEGGRINGFSADARSELEKHLSLVCGGVFRPAGDNAQLEIVLGAKAPGSGEVEPHTSADGLPHQRAQRCHHARQLGRNVQALSFRGQVLAAEAAQEGTQKALPRNGLCGVRRDMGEWSEVGRKER